MNATITLPRPYDKQQAILDSTATRKVVCSGRRAGKTTTLAEMAAHKFLAGGKTLVCSTSQDQADLIWRRLTEWFAPLIGLAYKNETKRVLELGAGRIRVKTGSNADALRGEDADLLLLDECAYLDADAWYSVGAPMLADRDGTAVFVSTPNRKNWFYLLFEHAKADVTGRWQAWTFPSHANPYLSQTALTQLAGDMGEDAYRQEIMAEFLESGGEVFRNIQACATAERRAPYAGRFVFGLDWAQKVDSTVIAVLDMDTRTMVDMDRFNGVSWALQRGRVRAMADKWKPYRIIAEENSIGSPNIEALRADGLPVQAFMTTQQSKTQIIESLALAFERGEITVLNDGVLTGELSAYERIVSPSTGRSQFSAPDGLHDDCVMALAMGFSQLIKGVTRTENW